MAYFGGVLAPLPATHVRDTQTSAAEAGGLAGFLVARLEVVPFPSVLESEFFSGL